MRVTLTAIAAGGICGALARYGLNLAFPTPEGRFPWTTFAINGVGCLLIGVLMAWLSAKAAPPWVRPLLGIGVLGGFTTFSTYTVEALRLSHSGRPLLGLAYVFATVLTALLAVWCGSRLTRKVLRT